MDNLSPGLPRSRMKSGVFFLILTPRLLYNSRQVCSALRVGRGMDVFRSLKLLPFEYGGIQISP